MIIKIENAEWMPSIDEPLESVNQYGWLELDDEIWNISSWHSYDDLGATIETLTIEKDGEEKQIYSYDEGESFTFSVE